MRKSINRQSGMSLIEVMVVLAIMSVLIYGMAGMFEQLQKQQSMLALNSTYQNIHNQIVGALQNKTGWGETVRDPLNAEMQCMRDSTVCAVNNTTPVWNELAVRSGDISSASTLVLDSGVVTSGFTLSGAPCNTFVRPGGLPAQPGGVQPGDDPATGNDACPIGYRVMWAGSCPNGAVGATTCPNPSVRIWALALWNPGPGINLPPPNLGKYSTEINRGSGIMNEPVIAFEGISGPAGTPTGSCTPGTFVPRVLTSPVNVSSLDPGDNITTLAAGGIQLRAGEYDCTAYVPGFGVDGFQAQILVDGSMVGNGSSYAPQWVQTTAVVNARFTLTAAGTLQVQMNCAQSRSSFDFGVPSAPYWTGGTGSVDAQRLTTVQCSRVN